jgi:hypothetical protein
VLLISIRCKILFHVLVKRVFNSVSNSNLLVDEMSDEPGGGHAPGLVVALESSLEVDDQPPQQQLANVRKFRVDDRRL